MKTIPVSRFILVAISFLSISLNAFNVQSAQGSMNAVQAEARNPMYQQLVEKFNVKGVPTIVFLDRSGQERLDLRLVEFMKPQDFITHIKKVQ